MLNITNKIRTDPSTLKTCLPVHLSHVNHHVGNNLPPRKTTTIEDTVNKIHHNGKTGTTGANGSPPPATTNPPGHPGNQTTPALYSTNTLPGTPLTSIHTILQPAHPERMKAASELPEEERPKPNASIDIEQFQDAVTFLRAVDRRIPEEIAKQAISLISSARLLQEFDLSKARVVELKNVGAGFPTSGDLPVRYATPVQRGSTSHLGLDPWNPHPSSMQHLEGSFARPTGLTTKISLSPTYRPSVHFTLAVRSLKRTTFP